MRTETRQEKIVAFLRQQSFARLPDLAFAVGVSPSTARRDVIELEQLGTVRRTHGGVILAKTELLPTLAGPADPAIDQAKKEIAVAAAHLIRNGDTILLDGGSSTFSLAELLLDRQLQIITNSLPVATLFTRSSDCDVVMLGGHIYSRSQVALGPQTVAMLKTVDCQMAFLSAAGINESGLFNSNLLLVETEKAMMQCADKTVVLADHSKFGRKSMAKICDLRDVDEMIVDQKIGDHWPEILRSKDIDLHLASNLNEG